MTMPSGTPLPKNVAATGDLGTSLQHLNSGKVEDKSQNQMSAGFLGSSGGLASGVVTSVTALFGGFMGNLVDDASSVTAESPEDVEQQVETFFGNPGSKLLTMVLGRFFELVTGVPEATDTVAAGFIRDTVRMLLGGYRNVDPASIPEAEVTPLELTVMSSEIQNRITSLEGGVTEFLIASSQEVDVSMYAEIQVIMFGSSKPGTNGASTGFLGGLGTPGGGYVFQPFTKQDLLDFGLNPAALKCVVGANGGPSYVGADSLTAPTTALVKTLEGSNVVGTPEGYEPTMSGPSAGGDGGYFNASIEARTGKPGGANAIAAGGAGGLPGIDGSNQTTATGKPGNPGQNGQTVGLTKCGGSGGGGGGSGGAWDAGIFIYGQNGGNGATGGFPGGGSGGGGAAGQGDNGRGAAGIGGAGVNGLIFLRGKGVAT